MKRYFVSCESGGEAFEDADGEFVMFEDAQEAVDEALEEGNTLVERVLAAADELQRQLTEVTEERDQLRAMLDLADALRNKDRGYTLDAVGSPTGKLSIPQSSWFKEKK